MEGSGGGGGGAADAWSSASSTDGCGWSMFYENSMKKIKRQSLPPRVNGDEQVEQEVPPIPSFCKRFVRLSAFVLF